MNTDPSSQPSCNRPALEVITLRREHDRRDVHLALSDAWEMADACAQRERELQTQVDRNAWWDRYGLLVSVGSFFLGASVGAIVSWEVMHAR